MCRYTTCISFEDVVCQVFDMARKPPPWRSGSTLGIGGGGGEGGGGGGGGGGSVYNPYDFGRGIGARGGADGVTLSDIRKSKLAPGIFGVLTNHNDMLLRRSTAEFSKSDVPM